ncbi:MAG: enoyl-CoA hydratase-related protein [Anaerolineales bacterium]|jgi:2-(1,2-epoxy-1,2-dihydrophenyl)acetyl-CoA isomerase
MSNSPTILTEFSEGVQTITLNRPERANAINTEMALATLTTLKTAEHEKRVRSVLLAGSGDFFSSGQDLAESEQPWEISYQDHLQKTYNPLILQIRRMQKPIIAALKGTVAGAALGIALACDLRIAAKSTQFQVGFSGIGLALDSAVSLLLPTIIGLGRASELAFTNAAFSAEQALEWGMINRIVPAKELQDRALEWAQELASGPTRAIGLTKLTLNKGVLPNLVAALDYEAYTQEIAKLGKEHREGLRAFLEKRKPIFKGSDEE